MIYSATIITPKNTLLTAVKRTPLTVSNGLVYKVEVDFPAGSAGLMGVAICDGSYQIWPSSLGEWFTGDSILISFEDIYLKQSAPFKFDVLTYNLDDSYDHKVNIRIGFVTADIFMARFLPSLSYKYFEQMLNNLSVMQAKLTAEQQEAILNSPFSWLKQQ